MSTSPNFTRSHWFLTLLGLLVSLGAQVVLGALIPLSFFDGLNPPAGQAQVVLIAGETSLWRGHSIIRALSFGLGALVACLLASRFSWRLVTGLVAFSFLASTFAQFPGVASMKALALWLAAAPSAALLVGLLHRAWWGAPDPAAERGG